MSAARSTCPRCSARQAALPLEAQIRILTTEDWDIEQMAFVPRPMSQEQAVSAELLTAAIGRYWHAFGVECTGARLKSLLLILRDRAKRMRITQRILEARSEINARARECYDRGDHEAAHAIEAEPTPPYEWQDRDNAWMEASR
jgi:hypothetical protein